MNPFARLPIRPQYGVLPKFWRPKLAPAKQLTCKVIHWDLVTKFVNGTATASELWDWIEAGYTYGQMMKLFMADGEVFTDAAVSAMAEQLATYEDVIARYRTKRRVGFNAEELRIARAAAHVMDRLLELDRHGVAERATHWSNDQMRALRTTGKSSRLSF